MGQKGPKHVGASGFYNSIVNLIQVCALVGLGLPTGSVICAFLKIYDS
jgi:hypothetical protein